MPARLECDILQENGPSSLSIERCSTGTEVDVLEVHLLVRVDDTSSTTGDSLKLLNSSFEGNIVSTYHIRHCNSRTSVDINTGMRLGLCWHTDLDACQPRALSNSPLQCSDFIRRHACRIQDDVLEQSHEARFGVSTRLVVTHDEELALEIEASADDGWVLWISQNYRTNSEIECALELVNTSWQKNFRWVTSRSLCLTTAAIAIIINGFLKCSSLVSRPVVLCSVVKNIAVHWVDVRASCIWRVTCPAFCVILRVEPIRP